MVQFTNAENFKNTKSKTLLHISHSSQTQSLQAKIIETFIFLNFSIKFAKIPIKSIKDAMDFGKRGAEMGGIGSGRPKTRDRPLVEDCDYLDISIISKYGFWQMKYDCDINLSPKK